ncbi:hypothetical protein CDAR_253531 [Caerostris darwini]|uniref:Uncharacterized protein n=1 Tax=Caerostris darwini TaxID=1538125 RepID=A0AAV4MKA9_9ARAC|nr:hypothetical protein CDAR_253531 [Caerostris darwini]
MENHAPSHINDTGTQHPILQKGKPIKPCPKTTLLKLLTPTTQFKIGSCNVQTTTKFEHTLKIPSCGVCGPATPTSNNRQIKIYEFNALFDDN